MPTVADPLLWGLFLLFVLMMLALDLGVFHKKAHAPSFREALGWTATWAVLAILFGGWVGWQFGGERAIEFYTGWVIEQSLSIDNVFVFVVIFAALRIPAHLQHRVLFWGILSALVLRAVMILGGAALVTRFHWILYLFGAFLVLTGVKLLWQKNDQLQSGDSRLMSWLRRKLRVTDELHGQSFWIRVDGRLRATPMLLALLMVEVSDVIFAVDSIPAIFAVTTDPFLVFTSNIFAIMGLRSLFFVLASMVDRFVYLKPALAVVLAFVGTKLLLQGTIKIPPMLSLAVVVGVLGGAVVASLLRTSIGARPPVRDVS
ncbi:MAG: TerC family protein [Planctomycetes bacterium]|nr:TerC family protein [Planctomycetota bacterium]